MGEAMSSVSLSLHILLTNQYELIHVEQTTLESNELKYLGIKTKLAF